MDLVERERERERNVQKCAAWGLRSVVVVVVQRNRDKKAHRDKTKRKRERDREGKGCSEDGPAAAAGSLVVELDRADAGVSSGEGMFGVGRAVLEGLCVQPAGYSVARIGIAERGELGSGRSPADHHQLP